MGKEGPDRIGEIAGPIARARARQAAERKRVERLLRDDRREARRERERKDARAEADAGKHARLQEAVDGPTREQFRKQNYRPFTVDKEKGSAHRVKGYRRVLTPRVVSLYRKRIIDDDELAACLWYRDRYEASGLVGAIPSTDFAKEVFTEPHAREKFSEGQSIAQDELRFVRAKMPKRFLRFFDAIVLNDLPMYRAERIHKCRSRGGKVTFRELARTLAEARAEMEGA